ncbi:MAG: Na+/H+ antiporter NhaC family protein, partial [Akkermansia sp.]|nr:Na+/H+ antiporter NhaC family protein [Akkermansia sp.]
LATAAGSSVPLMAGAVVGGAFFGDNLSFISDTTIAATRTQGCAMKDKFRANFRIVLPAAVIVFLIYTVMGWSQPSSGHSMPESPWLVMPYLLVLVCALCGMNVMRVLILGLLGTGVASICMQSSHLMDWAGAMGQGIVGMGELIIVTLLAAGVLELIRYNGGLSYIISHLCRHIHGRRGAELGLGTMTMLANFCTANNTVAIVAVGNIARRVAQRYGVSPTRAASILDTFSCVAQSIIPYGAQLLMGATLAGLTSLQIIPYLFYPFCMCASALLFIAVRHKQ